MQALHFTSLFTFLFGLFLMGKQQLISWTLMVFFSTVQAYVFYTDGNTVGYVSHILFAFICFYGSFYWTIVSKNEVSMYPDYMIKIIAVTVILIGISVLFTNMDATSWITATSYALMAIALILFSIKSIYSWGILLAVSIANTIAIFLFYKTLHAIDNSYSISVDMFFYPAIAIISIYGYINQQLLLGKNKS